MTAGAELGSGTDLALLLERLAAGPQPWVLLIDGRSGAGKTVLARRLAAALPGTTLVSLDDVYPGWDGLEAGSDAVPGIIRDGTWRRWDWVSDGPGEVASVARTGSLIVEGCGAISRASRALADHAWWLQLDDAERKRRALERDGDTYAPHWDRWAAQELAHDRSEHPRELADLILGERDGAAGGR